MSTKYIEPATGKESFTCPHCGVISLMHFHCISYVDKNVIEQAKKGNIKAKDIDMSKIEKMIEKPRTI